MSERIVEVVWEDTLTSHAWNSREEMPTATWTIHSVGYVVQDDDAGLLIVEAKGEAQPRSTKDYGCATIIPRSAIREVSELSRKRVSRHVR